MLDLVRLCLSRTRAAPPGSQSPAGRHRGVARAPGALMPGHTRGERSKCLCRRSMTASRKSLRRRCGRYSPPSASFCWPRTGSGRGPPGSSRAAARRRPPGQRIRLRPRLRRPPPNRPDRPDQPDQARRTRGGGRWTRRGTSGCSTGVKNRTTKTYRVSLGPFLNRLLPRHRPPSTRLPRSSQPSLSPPSPAAEPAEPAPAEPAPPGQPRPPGRTAEALPAEPALRPPSAADGQALPVPNYSQLSVPSLRARLRALDPGQVQTLLDYEKAHESRPAVITMFERRLTKLGGGN